MSLIKAPSQLQSEQKLLSFKLGEKDVAGIPLESIIEVFPFSLKEILPVPEVPECVLGLYNWRGEMLWWVDLEHMLGMPPLTNSSNSVSTHMAMVIQVQEKTLGLLIRELLDIELLDLRQIKTPTLGLFPGQLLPFLAGYFLDENQETLISFAPEAIVESSLWKRRNY